MTDEIKTLTSKSRYNDVLEQQCAKKNLSFVLLDQKNVTPTSSNSIQSNFDPFDFDANLRSTPTLNINFKNNDALKQNSTILPNEKSILVKPLFQNKNSSHTLNCKESIKPFELNINNPTNSKFFLPPASELLLSGLNNDLNIKKKNDLILINYNNSLPALYTNNLMLSECNNLNLNLNQNILNLNNGNIIY